MRLWHYKLLPYLPDAQFKGQLREAIAIMRDWRDKGTTNHILINRVMDYPKANLSTYFAWYCYLYKERYGKNVNSKYIDEFYEFKLPYDTNTFKAKGIFNGWHDLVYLKICMMNLYEKHLAKGKSRITGDEWNRLLDGYKSITRKKWRI